MMLENVGWWLMAGIAIIGALGMVSSKNPVHSALWLVVNFVSLAVIYLILSAPMLFAIQMIVYAGAIMVLFLFVVMFFMAPSMRQWLRPPLKSQLVIGGALVLVFIVLLMGAFMSTTELGQLDTVTAQPATPPAQGGPESAEVAQAPVADEPVSQIGIPKYLGSYMFKNHTLPFELTSILLLVALLGAVMVARDTHSEGREHVEEFTPTAHGGSGGEVAK